jgi:hypothetical protein
MPAGALGTGTSASDKVSAAASVGVKFDGRGIRPDGSASRSHPTEGPVAIGAWMMSLRGSLEAIGSLGTAKTLRSVPGPLCAKVSASPRKSWRTDGTVAMSSTAMTIVT